MLDLSIYAMAMVNKNGIVMMLPKFTIWTIISWMCTFFWLSTLVAASTIKTKADEACTPHQVHLTLDDTSGSTVVVLWSTRSKDCESRVTYAAHPWDLDQSAVGVSAEWTSQNVSFPFLHKVVLQDMSPANTYYYRPAGLLRTQPYMFKVPQQGNNWSPSFLVMSGPPSPEVIEAVSRQEQTGQYTALLYNGLPNNLDDQAVETMLSDISQVSRSLPLIATAEKTAGDQLRQLSRPVSDSKLWYSVDIGPVHIISYSTELLFEKDQSRAKAQQAWLIDDLTEVNQHRDVTPWIVAMGNQPMYCSSGVPGRDDCATNTSVVRHGLEDLFYHFAVDLVLESHPLGYQRQWPQYKGVLVAPSYLQPSTPVEVVLSPGGRVSGGAGGNGTGLDGESKEWSALDLSSSAQAQYLGSVTVHNASHLHWTLMDAATSQLVDQIWLVQDHHGNFSLASLPQNISHQINQTILAMGGKPGTYDFVLAGKGDNPPPDTEGLSKYSLWIGLAVVGGGMIVVASVTTALRACARRRRTREGRRWREIDKDGGARNFYSVASDSDTDDNDFEIDVYDKTSKQSSKLLTSY